MRDLSLPSRGVWIEMLRNARQRYGIVSLPSRGVWIEIWNCELGPGST